MRAFVVFLAVFIGAGAVAACVAYPAYEFTSMFASWAFHRVAGRIAMLVLALELIGVCRHLGIRTKSDFGYGLPWRRFVGVSAAAALLGVATAGVGAAFLLASGLRIVAPDFVPTAPGIARLLLTALGSGLAVALIEETVMRGAMHTAIEREAGPSSAALTTAPLFAALHFFAKVRIPDAELAWRSGYDLLVRSFAPLAQFSQVFDSFASWLAVGLILSLTRILTGNIAVAIGLHAGWVVVLRLLQESTVRGSTPDYGVWVGRFDGLLGYWILPWAAAIATALWFTRVGWVPQASSASASKRSSGSFSSR